MTCENTKRKLKGNKFFPSTLLLIVLSLPLTFSLINVRASLPNSSPFLSTPAQVEYFLNEINLTRIEADVAFFSNLKSRVAGYSGFYEAAKYIIERFNEMNLNVTVQAFKTVIPYEVGSWIYVDTPINANITAYALWPNGGVASSVVKMRGRIYYVGKGSLADLNGIDLNDAILLIDFNSGYSWINAASFGVKAVIFTEPADTDKYEALSKGSIAPINFPRFYVDATYTQILMEAANVGAEVVIHSEMRWMEVEAYNILAELKGADSDDVIILSAHYDSWSIVPSLSPAAEDAIGISSLLEVAKCLSRYQHRRTIWFVAYAGHWEGMAGPSIFVEDVILKTAKRIWLQIGLDFSDETPYLDVLALSPVFGTASGVAMVQQAGRAFAPQPEYVLRFLWVKDLFNVILASFPFKEVGGIMAVETDSISRFVRYNFETNYWWGTQSDFYMLDTELSNLAGSVGVTLMTQGARRMHWLTPLNNLLEINWDNVRVQVLIAAFLVNGIVNTESLGVEWTRITPKRSTTFGTSYLSYVTLEGKVVEFSYEKGWYVPVPGALVRLQIYIPAVNSWPFSFRYTVSDEHGAFKFYGLSPMANWVVDAWKFDEKTGDIIYAIDEGFYGRAQGISGGISNIAYALGEVVSVQIALFRCVSVTIFNLIDTRTIRRIIVHDLRNPFHNFFDESGTSRLEVYDALTRSIPVFYGRNLSPEGIGVFFLKPNGTYIFTFNPHTLQISRPAIVLSNSSETNPEGTGYFVKDHIKITLTMFKSAADMFYIINSRYSKLEVYYVRRPMIEELLSRSAIYLENANNFLRNFTYEKAYQNILIATSYLSRAYSSELMPTYEEATYSITFFSLLIILFSVFSSKFFMMSGFKKFLTVFIIALSLFCIFYFVHPSFYIIANSMIAIVGVGIALLLTFIILIFMMDIKSLLEKVSVDKLGFHLFKQEDLAIMIQTIIVSIENMKRRPLLTSLVFLTIIMYTAAQVSLTSTVPILTLTKTEITANSPYNGVLIKNVYGAPPEGTLGGILDIPIFDFLYGLVGNNYTLSPRVWLYPRPTYPEGVQLTFISLKEEGKTLTVQPVAVLGISDEEIKKFNMITGGWMEFLSDYQCIFPYSISNQLNVTVGDKIYILGLDRVFTVSGIMDIGVEHIDFDGRSLYPLDPGFSADLQLAPPIFVDIEPFSLSPSNVIVIPWKTALKLGGFISSIALIPKIEVTAESLRNVASEIVYGTDLMVYFGYEGRSYGLWKVSTFQFLGWESSSILLIIISLSIANLMMGSYQMRRKEIDTCSVLGLSPKGASLMYLTESLIFALGGTIIGYLLGFALNRVFISIGVLPQSFIFNFASISIILSMAILIVAVMLSSLYPSIIISKHVTPSLERRWKVSSKPRGDIWELKMPLKADENEVLGVLMYLREYFEGLGSEQPKFRITNIFGINPREKSFSLQILLLPAELSIVQNTLIQGILEGRDYSFYLVIRRVSGEPKQWVVRCPQFIDHIRKQLLLWKTLDPKKKAEYVARSRLLTTESAY